jgi:flagellar hook protein FlgE
MGNAVGVRHLGDGEIYTVGYIALAKVTNPNGVTHIDGRYYQAQDGAGEIRVTSVKEAVSGIESAGDTKLITGGLESSGTDLATEITNMITVQRGYQANTRIVTVTDSMLEELVNMKR